MKANPSQDSETPAQAQAEWRALKMIRPAAAVVVLAAVATFGIAELAIGHYRSGLTLLGFIGTLAVLTIAGRILRRRHSGG